MKESLLFIVFIFISPKSYQVGGKGLLPFQEIYIVLLQLIKGSPSIDFIGYIADTAASFAANQTVPVRPRFPNHMDQYYLSCKALI